MPTDLAALEASLSVLLLVARDTNDVLIARYEALVADGKTTFLAAETLLVPLFAHVFVFLHT